MGKYKVIQNFSATSLTGIIGQELIIKNPALEKDLLRANFIVSVNDEDVVLPDESNVDEPMTSESETENNKPLDTTDEEQSEVNPSNDGDKPTENGDEEEPHQEDSETEDFETTKAMLENKNLTELKEICKNLGVKATGNKENIIADILKVYNG